MAGSVGQSGHRGCSFSRSAAYLGELAYSSGVSLSALQEMGGWESSEVVQGYVYLAPNHLTEYARKIDSVFGSDGTNTT